MSDGKFIVILVMTMAIIISFSSVVVKSPINYEKQPMTEKANVLPN